MVDLTTMVGCCAPLAREPLTPDQAVDLARVFKAMGDPVRLRLLSLIASHEGGEACVCDLSDVFELTGPTISHHLKVLREAGLITGDRRGTWIYYRVQPEALRVASTVLTPAARPPLRQPDQLSGCRGGRSPHHGLVGCGPWIPSAGRPSARHPGRAQGRGVGQVQVGELGHGHLVEEGSGVGVDALADLGTEPAHQLRAQQSTGATVAGHADRDRVRARVVGLVVIRAGGDRCRIVAEGGGLVVA